MLFFCSSFLFRHVRAISSMEEFRCDVRQRRRIPTVKSATRFPFTPTSWSRIPPFQVSFTMLLPMKNVSLPARAWSCSWESQGQQMFHPHDSISHIETLHKGEGRSFTLTELERWVTSFHSWTWFLFSLSLSLARFMPWTSRWGTERVKLSLSDFIKIILGWKSLFAGGAWVAWGQFVVVSSFTLFCIWIVYLFFCLLIQDFTRGVTRRRALGSCNRFALSLMRMANDMIC